MQEDNLRLCGWFCTKEWSIRNGTSNEKLHYLHHPPAQRARPREIYASRLGHQPEHQPHRYPGIVSLSGQFVQNVYKQSFAGIAFEEDIVYLMLSRQVW